MFNTPQKRTSSPSETPKRNYVCYVVWEGRKPGIYLSWRECSDQVKGFRNNAYKGFYSYEEAQAAFESKRDSTLHDEASEGSSSKMCPTCKSLSLRNNILEARVTYLSEKLATLSDKSVSDNVEELSDILDKHVVLDHH